MKILRELFLLPVHFYRYVISPLKGGAVCRYTPSCSIYFVLAVRKFGPIKGSILGWARIFRCRNRYFGGYDPIPEKYSFRYVKEQYIIRRKPKGFDKSLKENQTNKMNEKRN